MGRGISAIKSDTSTPYMGTHSTIQLPIVIFVSDLSRRWQRKELSHPETYFDLRNCKMSKAYGLETARDFTYEPMLPRNVRTGRSHTKCKHTLRQSRTASNSPNGRVCLRKSTVPKVSNLLMKMESSTPPEMFSIHLLSHAQL